jgi:hypothetical protein
MAKQSPADQLVALIPTIGTDWRQPFVGYLTSADVPQDKTEMEHLIQHSKHYVLVEWKLMCKNTKEELLQKCMSQEHRVKILEEIHAGTCGNHAASHTLVGKAF